ncbi:hypothetical protein PS723_05984 [Pseudomonas fluorescens]|uniref:Uncharacterized protein n=1 Tax=Pseudomonas fluorescens TaxID=294 RepID=A0A5E7FSF6_PSEFL|nr:hypothetical protein PS723_05984 [Pseudomonas fluorescens]
MLRNVIDAITEVINVVVEKLVWRTIGGCAWSRLTLFASRSAFTWLLLASRTVGASCGRRLLFAALVLALVFTTAATTAAVRTVTTWTARSIARVTHIWTLTDFRFLGFYGTGVKTHQVAIGDFLLGHALDAFQQFFFIRSHQRDRLARTTGAASTADPVHIVFVDVRQLEVDHVWQLVDIQAAGGDIGGNQDPHFAGLEVGQGFGSGVLALVTVDGNGGEAVLVQILGQAVGAVLGAGENQDLFPGAGSNQVSQQ